MFDQQCLRNDGARATRPQQSGQGRQKMHEEHQKVTHGPRSYRYRLRLQVYEIGQFAEKIGFRQAHLGDANFGSIKEEG